MLKEEIFNICGKKTIGLNNIAKGTDMGCLDLFCLLRDKSGGLVTNLYFVWSGRHFGRLVMGGSVPAPGLVKGEGPANRMAAGGRGRSERKRAESPAHTNHPSSPAGHHLTNRPSSPARHHLSNASSSPAGHHPSNALHTPPGTPQKNFYKIFR